MRRTTGRSIAGTTASTGEQPTGGLPEGACAARTIDTEIWASIGLCTDLTCSTVSGPWGTAPAEPGDLRDAGYRVAYAMAGDNLRLGRVVIGDCVNDWKLVRDAWQAAGERASAEVRWIEIVCSDLVEHRRRVETRVSEVPGLVLPDWHAVIGREYHAWDREHVVIDTAGRRIEDCVAAVMTALGDGAPR